MTLEPVITFPQSFGSDSKIKGLKNSLNIDKKEDIVWKDLGQYLETLVEVPSIDSNFKNNLDIQQPLDSQINYRICTVCYRPILTSHLRNHIQTCIEMKQQKEKNSFKKIDETDSKKRTRDQTPLEFDQKIKIKKPKKEPNTITIKQKKKNSSKNKGPVDVEKQCGVALPSGGFCARSLTCKTHSMGAKRAVPGRSAPYDVLLSAYQHKNQVKIAGQAAKAQADKDELMHGGSATLDSDEETQAVLSGVSRSFPLPLERKTLVPTRVRTKFLRMREMFAGAILPRITNSNGVGGMNGRTALLDIDKPNEHLFLVRAPQRIMLNKNNIQQNQTVNPNAAQLQQQQQNMQQNPQSQALLAQQQRMLLQQKQAALAKQRQLQQQQQQQQRT